jgi:hypothetical protein
MTIVPEGERRGSCLIPIQNMAQSEDLVEPLLALPASLQRYRQFRISLRELHEVGLRLEADCGSTRSRLWIYSKQTVALLEAMAALRPSFVASRALEQRTVVQLPQSGE